METWLSDRKLLPAVAPKSGSTGELDIWLSDRQPFTVYVEAAAAPAGSNLLLKQMLHLSRSGGAL